METREDRSGECKDEGEGTGLKDEIVRLLSPLRPLHFEEGVGLLFAIVKCGGDNEMKMLRIPIVNNWAARSIIQEFEQRADFYAWAVDPFSGVVNIKVQVPEMNE